jgi:hypothetical protein
VARPAKLRVIITMVKAGKSVEEERAFAGRTFI